MKSRGFTLLELLIAISLLSLILLMLFSALRTASRSLEAVETATAEHDELRAVEAFLRRLVRQSRTLFMAADDGRRVVAFRGEARRIELVSPLPGHVSRGGLYQVRIELDDEGGLWLRWQPFRQRVDDRSQLEADSGEVKLLGQVDALAWRYYGDPEGGVEPRPDWHSDWEAERSRPELVELRFDWQGETVPIISERLLN